MGKKKKHININLESLVDSIEIKVAPECHENLSELALELEKVIQRSALTSLSKIVDALRGNNITHSDVLNVFRVLRLAKPKAFATELLSDYRLFLKGKLQIAGIDPVHFPTISEATAWNLLSEISLKKSNTVKKCKCVECICHSV